MYYAMAGKQGHAYVLAGDPQCLLVELIFLKETLRGAFKLSGRREKNAGKHSTEINKYN